MIGDPATVFGDRPTAVATAIIEHALDFDGRYGVHTSPRPPQECQRTRYRRTADAAARPGAFRPGQIAAPAFAVLGAKFLLIDEIKAVISAALTFGTFLASAASMHER
jgi:hypothetical protein